MILVLSTVPFYHFLFSRYLDLTKCHFLSDILVPFPDSNDLYSGVMLPFLRTYLFQIFGDVSCLCKVQRQSYWQEIV